MKTLFLHLVRSQRKALLNICILLSLAIWVFVLIETAIVSTQTEISNQVKPTLWWDIRLEQNDIWTQEQKDFLTEFASEYWLTSSQRLSLLYTAIDDNENVQAFQLLAVDENYPLYGDILDKNNNRLSVTPSSVLLTPAWVDFFLWKKTWEEWENITTQAINIEKNDLTVWWTILSSPDAWWFSFVNNGELLYAHIDTINNTDLVTTWSRIEYERLFKTQNDIQTEQLVEILEENELFDDVDDYLSSNQSIADRVQDFRTFLLVIVLVTLALFGTILFFVVESFFFGTRRESSVLYLLWASKRRMTYLYIGIFTALFLIGGGVWLSLAYGATFIVNAQTDLITLSLTSSDIVKWVSISFVLLCMALVLPLAKRLTASPLAGLKNSLYQNYTVWEFITLISIQVLWLLLVSFLELQTVWRSLLLVVGVCVLVLILYAVSALSIKTITFLTRWFKKKKSTYAIFDGIRMLTRPGNMTGVMRISRSVTILSLTLVWLFGTNLFYTLTSAEQNIPDFIVLNIPWDKADDYTKSLSDIDASADLFSRVWTRIVSINQVPLSELVKDMGARQWEFSREYSATISPLNDTILQWKDSLGENEVSLDSDFADSLNIQLWDTVTISVIWREFAMKVVSLRQRSEEVGVFFFLQLPQEQFADAPLTYFSTITTSLPAEQVQSQVINSAWPSVSFINANTLAQTIQDITGQIVTAVSAFGFALVIIAMIVLVVCLDRMVKIFRYTDRLYFFLWAQSSYMKKFFISHSGSIIVSSSIFGIVLWFFWSYILTQLSPFITVFWTQNILFLALLSLFLVCLMSVLWWRYRVKK